jgi:hypothetical protein
MTNLKLALADEDFKHVWGAEPFTLAVTDWRLK